MPSKTAELKVQIEGCMLLAIKAVKEGQISSTKAAANIYDVLYSTLKHHIWGCTACLNISANNQRLIKLEKSSLKQ